MRRRHLVWSVWAVLWAVAVTCLVATLKPSTTTASSSRFDRRYVSTIPQASLDTFWSLPVTFEAHDGGSFLARADGMHAVFTSDAVVLRPGRGGAVRLGFGNRASRAHIEAREPLSARRHFYVGADPAAWRTGVPLVGRIAYRDVYPGIDVEFYGNQRQLEFDFVVKPGADPRGIRLSFSGATPPRLRPDGALVLATEAGDVVQHAPHCYQEREGERVQVDAAYSLLADGTVGLTTGTYDEQQPLIIDPVLTYSSYVGGGLDDHVRAVTVDPFGNVVVVGYTSSLDFPTTLPAIGTRGGIDVFVTRFTPTGQLLSSTILAGNTPAAGQSAADDTVEGVATDTTGAMYIVGSTTSTNFPTASAFDASHNGQQDVFVAKLQPAGTLAYSTYLGSAGFELGLAVAVDAAGSAYIVGDTGSAAFPVTPGGPAHGGNSDTFITKLAPAGAALLYSRFLGGSLNDHGEAVSVTPGGVATVAGETRSTNFPAAGMPGVYDNVFNGVEDVYVARYTAAGALQFATFLGGSSEEKARGLAVDATGNSHVTGYTTSVDFPAGEGTFGGQDVFVAKFNSNLSALLYSVPFGDTSNDVGWEIGVDLAGDAYVIGDTFSSEFPTTADAFDSTLGGPLDAFVSKLDDQGHIVYSTYFGNQTGATSDAGRGLGVAGTSVFFGGTTNGALPITGPPFDSTHNGAGDAFVSRFSDFPLRYDNYTSQTSPAGFDSPVNVGGVNGIVDRVTVSLWIAHAFTSDLNVFLRGPDGTEVLLASDVGGAGDNFGTGANDEARTTFADAAVTPITSGSPPFVGVFKPQQPLAPFSGKTGAGLNGSWVLRVEDVVPQFDHPTLLAWALNIHLRQPILTSVSPSQGSTSGGTTITLAGTNFVQGGTIVTFGGAPATSINVASSTSLTAVTPPGSTGTRPIVVTTHGGSGGPLSFTYAGDQLLTVTKVGQGTVTSAPAGINCGADCAEAYTSGTAVTLTATPAAGWVFSGWSGACTGASCGLVMNAPAAVTATFTQTHPLSVTKVGQGTVTSAPAGINCGADCFEAYPAGTSLALTATPAAGWVFSNWSGACTGATCSLVMNAPAAVTATFTQQQQNTPTITTLTPNHGSTEGLTPVTITGTNLSGATVTVGGNSATKLANTSTTISLITPAGPTGPTTVIVVTPAGQVSRPFTYVASEQTNVARSHRSALDYSGRYLAFESDAALVSEDTNGIADVYVLDRLTDTTRRVSVNSAGGQAFGGASGAPAISSSGRFVAFESGATNLVPNQVTGMVHAYLHDRDADDDHVFDEPGAIATIRVSVGINQGPLVGGGFAPSMSGNGRWVAFESLRVGSGSVQERDIFVHDRLLGTTTLASGGSGPLSGSSTAPALGANGRYLSFQSTSTNLVPGDTNGVADIFVRDRDLDADGVMDEAGATTIVRVSVSSNMSQALGGSSTGPSITQDGRWVVFVSEATNLVANDTNGAADLFLHDRDSDQDTVLDEPGHVSTVRLSVPPAGTQFGAVTAGVISANGQAVLFTVTNLVQAPPPNGPGLASVVSANNGTPGSNTGGTVFIPSPTVPDQGNNPVATETAKPGSTVGDPALSGNGDVEASTETPPGPNQPDEIVVEGPEPEDTPGEAVPQIHELDPAQGPAGGGIVVDIEGAFFTPDATVLWNGAPLGSKQFVSADEIRVTAPASNSLGQINVRVVVNGQASNPEDFTYSATPVSSPTITNVAPVSGSTVGGAVTISGTGFTGTQVFFGGNAGTITSVTPTTIEAQAPPHVAGTVPVAVVNTDGGTAVLDAAFTYMLPPPAQPTITSVAPAQGFKGGGTSFTVSGSGFAQQATSVMVGGAQATNVVVWSGTLLTAIAPASAQAGFANVAVIVPAAGNAVLPNSFEYIDVEPPFKGTADSDGDGMWNTFEKAFGLLEQINDAADDPDGDGRTNLQEFTDRTHPRGTNVRFLAEGAVNAFFSARLAIANPNDAPATVLARFLPEGATPIEEFLYIPAKSRRTIEAGSVTGLGGPFSTVLESDSEVVLDRTMTWQPGAGAHSGHAESSQPAPSPIWYLAEGSTTGFFDLFYLFQNPSLTEPAQVRVTFLLANGLPVIKEPYVVPPNGRLSLYVNQIPELAEADLSAIVESTNGVPIIVERAMYASPPGHPTFAAGHGSAGVTAPNPKWFLAEGATGDFFKTYVLIANPSATPAQVQITYLLPSGGPIIKTRLVAANSRATIDVSGEDPALAATSMSIVVEATNAVPIIVERAVWWPGGGPWYEAHNSPGTTSTGTKWAVADGELIATGSETFLLIANTSATPAQVKVTILFDDGTAPAEKTIAVGANSRHTMSVRGDFPAADRRHFGAIVESLGPAPARIVVERVMYAGVPLWNIGTNVLATKLQ
jgi:subtilisin-like proprotein convertase family protein